MRIGYGKIGQSMALSLEKCGTLGGDVESAAVVKTLAERHPEHTFVLIGRNDGSDPASVGLPANVENPWTEWSSQLLDAKRARKLTGLSRMTIEHHRRLKTIYDEMTLPVIRDLDQIILWSGPHGTANYPIPSVRDHTTLNNPYDSSAHYASYLLHGINEWRESDPWSREETWLNADPRTYMKMRDLKWPLRHPVLAQYNYQHNIKHERYGDVQPLPREWAALGVAEHLFPGERFGIWSHHVDVMYSRLEINGLVPGSPFGDLVSFNDSWDYRQHFGLFINETRRNVAPARSRFTALRDWILPLDPAWIHGTWSKESLAQLNIKIAPAPWSEYYPRLHSVHSTITTPASGSGWATTKPWEAFAAGTVCFFHPFYDTQDNILGDAPAELRDWLRVTSPEQFKQRVVHLHNVAGRPDWEWLVAAQREHFERAIVDLDYVKHIERRLFNEQ